MEWKTLDNEGQIENIKELSKSNIQLIFKHSTRCSISNMAYQRIKNSDNSKKIVAYYLDLLAYRNISNALAIEFKIEHQSPQILLIKNGVCVYNTSHQDIQVENIYAHL